MCSPFCIQTGTRNVTRAVLELLGSSNLFQLLDSGGKTVTSLSIYLYMFKCLFTGEGHMEVKGQLVGVISIPLPGRFLRSKVIGLGGRDSFNCRAISQIHFLLIF